MGVEGDASMDPGCVDVLLGEVPVGTAVPSLAFASTGISSPSVPTEEESLVSVSAGLGCSRGHSSWRVAHRSCGCPESRIGVEGDASVVPSCVEVLL